MKGILIDNDYELQVDVQLDQNGLITGGLVLGDLTFQNQDMIIKMMPGELKEAPLKGVGIQDYIDDESPEALIRMIRTQLSAEGMIVNKVGFDSTGDLVIDAKYKRDEKN